MSYDLIEPKEYHPLISPCATEMAILKVKHFFQDVLSKMLKLKRVTAPLFVKSGTGINDDLNGVEKPVSFSIKNIDHCHAEIVQSLAKWKRMTLADLNIPVGEGIYTDMNAIRPDDQLSNIHSIYVDQWDWEKVLEKEDRTVSYLKEIVSEIYYVIKDTESYVCREYPVIKRSLPDKITFIHSEELRERYPDLSPREREDAICKEYGAVFIIGIGAPLSDGIPHDGRAPDYDDWSTEHEAGKGLNGDILVWYPVLDQAVELSSMGIRVDRDALARQLELLDCTHRRELLFHQKLLNGELPLSVGGGIGQSRLCLFFLKKAHIGEVQASIWPDEMINRCQEHNIHLY